MISIFSKTAVLKEVSTGTYVKRVSSRIRGEEITEYLGARYNPPDRSEVNIYIKPGSIDGLSDGDYVDILDDIDLVPKLKERPGIKVIAMSQAQYEYLKSELKNEVYLIHHHHINFERFRRTRNKRLKGGSIGHSEDALSQANEIKKRLNSIDVDFEPILHYKTREDMLNFFKSIDFMVVWNIEKYKDYPHSHPTKLINASSFGIPVLSQPIVAYKEFDAYIPITDMDSLVEKVKLLKTDYDKYSDIAFNGAEPYHISHIAEKYRQLK